MKPKRLELRGFSSFQNETVIDFSESDMFVITGPTGSGKSSILDGIVFALYGAVPRYGNKNVIAPAINQGRNEAKLRFDFSVGDRSYTVVRVVRRTKAGAGTTDVALECGTEVLTRNERDLTEKIQQIVGLTFDQFTKCILLPQGEFASFLKDDPAKRTELLRDLLGFDFFRRLMKSANDKVQLLKGRQLASEARLSDFADATPERLEEIRVRLRQLETLIEQIDERQPIVNQIRNSLTSLKQQETDCTSRLGKLAQLKVPSDVVHLSEKLQKAESELAVAKSRLDLTSKVDEKNQQRLSQLPDRKTVREQVGLYEQQHLLREQLGQLESSMHLATTSELEANNALDAASAKRSAVVKALEQERTEHAAFAIARQLGIGSPCPVCGNIFQRYPSEVPTTLAMLEREATDAERNQRELQLAHQKAVANLSHLKENIERQKSALTVSQDETAGLSTLEELRKLAADLDRADDEIKSAFEKLKIAVRDQDEAQKTVSLRRAELDKGWQIIRSARDGLSMFAPPPLPHEDLGAAWTLLTVWSAEQSKKTEAETVSVRSDLLRLKAEEEAILSELVDVARSLSLTLKGPLRDECLKAATSLESEIASLHEKLLKVEHLKKECEQLRQRVELLAKLANLLRANNFETWYLNRSFRQLCVIASGILRDLSKGEYSLAVTDKNDFQILDHFNANEIRSVRTLSGGETFLASLSLALALSEQIAGSSSLVSKLESLFLDEGFGTLDADTLETVASTIEDMGAKGRMIGLITHVRELADRLPVRFEVQKGPNGSTVEKVFA